MKKQVISHFAPKVAMLYRKICFVAAFLMIASLAQAQSFVHPGALHSQEDFDRMKAKVAAQEEPWYSGWQRLTANSRAQLSWETHAQDTIYRGYDGVHRENYHYLMWDCHAAYMHALQWQISGDAAHADKAVEIMNAWSTTLKDIRGWTEQTLAEGIYGYVFANAGEIMRDYSGWAPEDFDRFKSMLRNIFANPAIAFLDPVNGRYNGGTAGNNCIDHYWANWGLGAVAGVMATAILCDDRAMYDSAMYYYKYGPGNEAIGNMVYYVYSDDFGQWQESGRDQAHSLMGIGLASSICEMAWKQGEDLYAHGNHRLYKGINYVARYNLGHDDVPYTTYDNCSLSSPQTVIGSNGRGEDRPIWELIYNHYKNRLGWNVPNIQQWAENLRPEGGASQYNPNSGGYDQVGFGTLTHTLEPGSGASYPVVYDSYPAVIDHTMQQTWNWASKILDGNDTDGSRWSSEGFPSRVVVDLGENMLVTGTRISTYQDRAYQFTIELDDNLDFSSPYTVDRSSNTSTSQPISDDFPAVTARYARINVTGASAYTGNWAAITEFEVEATPIVISGIKQLRNRTTGLYLDGMGRTSNGADCGQWANTTSTNAQWNIQEYNGNYRIRNVTTDLYLDGMGRTTNGSACGQWANTTSTNAQWRIEPFDGNYYRIQNVSTGLYLDGMGRTTNGSDCGQWANTSSTNAQWELVSVSSSARIGSSIIETAAEETAVKSTEIDIYPIPVSNKLTIKLSDDYSENTEVILHDFLGKLITRTKVNGKEHKLDFSAMPQGVYIITFTNANGSISRKVVKE